MMRNRLTKLFAALAVCCVMLVSASPSFAQGREAYRFRNYPRANVDRLIRQAETHSDQFAATLERVIDRNGFGRPAMGTRLIEQARDLQRQLDMLRQESDRTDNQFAMRSQVSSALNTAQSLNNAMRYRRMSFGFGVQGQWMSLRSDLNQLARIYNLRQLS